MSEQSSRAPEFPSKKKILQAAYRELEQFEQSKRVKQRDVETGMRWLLSIAVIIAVIIIGVIFLVNH